MISLRFALVTEELTFFSSNAAFTVVAGALTAFPCFYKNGSELTQKRTLHIFIKVINYRYGN